MGFEELVKFPGDLLGIAFNLDDDEIGVVLLGECWHLHTGDEVVRTGRVMDVPVGDGLIGRVIDPLGVPLDGERLQSVSADVCRLNATRRTSWIAARHRAFADKHQSHRRVHTDRTRPARINFRRPADRENRHRNRRDHQSG